MNKQYLILLLISLALSSCSKYHATLRKPTIRDGIKYGRIELAKNTSQFDIPSNEVNTKLPALNKWIEGKKTHEISEMSDLLNRSSTKGLIIIKDGNVIFEDYANGATKDSIYQVFSVSKAYTVSMLGIAIEDGYIKSVDQSISDFVDWGKKKPFNKITLSHLANMISGINHNEYRRIIRTLHFYYSVDANRLIDKIRIRNKPGKKFRYKSIDTQILSNCISNAVGKPLIEYMEEKLLTKLGHENMTYWSVDSPEEGNPKFYGGLNSTPRDLAKFG